MCVWCRDEQFDDYEMNATFNEKFMPKGINNNMLTININFSIKITTPRVLV